MRRREPVVSRTSRRLFSAVGLDAPVADLIDAHGDGRRRAVFHARRGTHDVLEVGFSAARAHRLVAIDRCPVLSKSMDGAIDAAWAIAEADVSLAGDTGDRCHQAQRHRAGAAHVDVEACVARGYSNVERLVHGTDAAALYP
jgi:hypothetical protein